MKTIEGKTYRTIAEIVESGIIPLSRKTIGRLIATGRLKALNIGGGTKRPRWLVSDEEAKRFMKAGDK